jgi:hypothetical protein
LAPAPPRLRARELFHSGPYPGERFPAHGVLTREQRKKIIRTALADVVCPGFAQVGVDPTEAFGWTKEKLG